MFLSVCVVVDHRTHQNVIRTLSFMCRCFIFSQFDIICDLLLNRRTATWDIFVSLSHIPTNLIPKFFCNLSLLTPAGFRKLRFEIRVCSITSRMTVEDLKRMLESEPFISFTSWYQELLESILIHSMNGMTLFACL